MAYRLADETVCIGEAPVSASYLNIEANVQGALAAGSDAVHPGFGFLSENAAFAEAVENAGLILSAPRRQHSPVRRQNFGQRPMWKKRAGR